MFDESTTLQLATVVRTTRIIVAALASGVVLFGGLVVLVIPGDPWLCC